MAEYLYSTPAWPVYTMASRAHRPWPVGHTGDPYRPLERTVQYTCLKVLDILSSIRARPIESMSRSSKRFRTYLPNERMMLSASQNSDKFDISTSPIPYPSGAAFR